MLTLPLIAGAASLNAKMNSMIALRTIVYFLTTSLISALIGLGLVLAVHPGSVETKSVLGSGNTVEDKNVDIVDKFLDLGRNLFPDNLFKAAFQTVRFFSITHGHHNGLGSREKKKMHQSGQYLHTREFVHALVSIRLECEMVLGEILIFSMVFLPSPQGITEKTEPELTKYLLVKEDVCEVALIYT